MKYIKNRLDYMKEKASETDCRTDVGITVGLIDGIIAMCRILKDRIDTDDENILGALEDLRDDEDLKKILKK